MARLDPAAVPGPRWGPRSVTAGAEWNLLEGNSDLLSLESSLVIVMAPRARASCAGYFNCERRCSAL